MPKSFHKNCQFIGLDEIYPLSEYGRQSFRKFIMGILIISERHPLVKTLMRSHAAIIAEQRRHVSSKDWYVIHPYSKFRIMWDLVMIFCIFMNMISEPILIAFWIFFNERTLYMTWIPYTQILCFIDILFKFITGYIERQQAVMDAKLIRHHYLKGSFVVDLIALFPWEIVMMHYRKSIFNGPMNNLRIISILKIYRIVGFYRYSFSSGRIFLVSDIYVRTTVFIVTTIVWWFWAISLQIFIPCFWMKDDSYRKPNIGYGSLTSQALNALFQGGSLFGRVGVGHLPPLSFDEMVVETIVSVMGVMWTIYALVVIIHQLLPWYTSSARYDVMTKQLKQYMESNRLPPELQRRILLYQEYNTKKTFFKESKLLGYMSVRLRSELLLHRSERLMRKITLFKKLPRAVVAKLAPHLRKEVYLPNDIIIKQGTLGEEMYFLASGSIAVYTRWGEEMHHLEDGSYFGEIAMVLKDDRRTTSAAAVGVCEVYSLHRDTFRTVLRPFRELYRGIEETARMRLEELLRYEEKRIRTRMRTSEAPDGAAAAAAEAEDKKGSEGGDPADAV